MNLKVSVIIPVYRVEEYLDECVESVVKQTYKNIDIILIDDGSPDNCPQMCDSWANKDKRIRVFHQQNNGLSAARNKGLELSKGEYILFVDSDDYIAETTVEKTVDIAEKMKADIVCFGVFKIDQHGKIFESTETFEKNTVNREVAMTDLAHGIVHDYSCNKLWRKELFDNVSFPVRKSFEDIATTYKLFSVSKIISYLPEEMYFYRKRKGSIIGQMKASTLNDLFVARKERYDFFKTNYPEAAEAAFELTAISALSFYDVSLWNNVNKQTLTTAVQFLDDNKNKVSRISSKMKLYLYFPCIYRLYRKIKHFIGSRIKRLLSCN